MKSLTAFVRGFHLRSVPFVALALAAAFSACATHPKAPKQYCSDGRDVPEWTIKGAAAFPGDAGKVFYGRGEASNIGNHALLRETADNRARVDLAKMFNVGVKSLMRDYMASTSASDQESSEQHVENAQKTLVNESLSGVMIVDSCEVSEKGIYYSLAKLDVGLFTNALDRHKELSTKMKEYIRANAEKAFENLDKEIEKGR